MRSDAERDEARRHAGELDRRRWEQVDRYVEELLLADDPTLEAALEANAAAGLPAHDVSPVQGRFLSLLAEIAGARRVLEIGTLGGYSTIWLARALPADGRIVSLEIDESYAGVARSNLAQAGLAERVEIRVGPATDSLQAMVDRGESPFDLIFIDADKPNNPTYLRLALALSRPGTVIVGDNVVREGAVIDPDSDDPLVQGVRAFYEILAADDRLAATTIQTVGTKGYDGFLIAVVRGGRVSPG
jgi:predicted O-methyltransferase YrrM